MSQPFRPKAHSPARRRQRALKIEGLTQLEVKALMAPVVATSALTATFTAATTPTNDNLGTVSISSGGVLATSAAPFTSVSKLTSNSSFGGDIVSIAAGPGGDFGKGVYAISRGAGENANAINRPGVIYRVDPTTGKSSVFFDLNTVISKIEPGGTAANSLGASTGLVNWYSIAFDPEGYFNGRPSMFVSSVDRLDPNKNVIFQIGSDGSYLGTFVTFGASNGGALTRGASSIYVLPPEQQTYLRGLVAGEAVSQDTTQGTSEGFYGLTFDANQYAPGTNLNSPTTLTNGVGFAGFTFGPQVGITTVNYLYPRSVLYSVFTNFQSSGGGITVQPGLSGVEGSSGDLLIGSGLATASFGAGGGIVTSYTDPLAATPDQAGAIITPSGASRASRSTSTGTSPTVPR